MHGRARFQSLFCGAGFRPGAMFLRPVETGKWQRMRRQNTLLLLVVVDLGEIGIDDAIAAACVGPASGPACAEACMASASFIEACCKVFAFARIAAMTSPLAVSRRSFTASSMPRRCGSDNLAPCSDNVRSVACTSASAELRASMTLRRCLSSVACAFVDLRHGLAPLFSARAHAVDQAASIRSGLLW